MPDRGGFRIDRHLYFRGHSGGGDGGKCPECPFFIIQPPRSGTPGWLFSLFHATDPPFSNKPPGWGGQSGWLFNFGPRRTLPECRCGRRAASFSHLEGHSGVAFVNIHGLGRSGLLIWSVCLFDLLHRGQARGRSCVWLLILRQSSCSTFIMSGLACGGRLLRESCAFVNIHGLGRSGLLIWSSSSNCRWGSRSGTREVASRLHLADRWPLDRR